MLSIATAAALPLAATHVVPLTAELCILVLLLAATGLGRSPGFAWAWTPWLAAIVTLDSLRTLQRVTGPPHAADVIAFERRIFGVQPVIELQHRFATAGSTSWYDVAASIVYLMHSPAPLLAGAALWIWRRDVFAPFVVSLVTAGVVGLAVYLAFPESPPWLAAQDGLLPPVRRIASEVIAHAGPLSGVYSGADPLPNAAMPSLHIAYPAIVAWWLIAGFGRRAAPIVLYPLLMCVFVVYLGEHYAVDVLAGLIVAALSVGAATVLTGARASEQRAAIREL